MSSTVEIHEVCDIFDGPHATPKKTATGPIYLGIDAITADCRLNPVEYNYLSEEDYKIWTKRVTPVENDIVFSYEATLGRYAMIPADFYGCLGRRLALIRVKDNRINPTWLYYYFMSPEWKVFVANHTVKGSTVDRISVEAFPSYKIPLIERKKQDDVVKILKSIDDKIENNNTICSELESMAKTLYDYWFVQFDFPDENGKPYRTSGGEMVWNELLKREIPKEWKPGKLCDIANITMGQSPAGESYNDAGDGLIFYQGRTDFGLRFPTPRMYTTAPTRFAQKGDILLSVRAPVGDLNFAMEDCCIGRGLAALNSKLGSQMHLFYTLAGFQQIFKVMDGNGTTFGSITKDTLFDMSVVIPPDEILMCFEKRVKPIESKIEKCEEEIRELTKLRDWLLPMLMNGQATVVDAEEEESGKVIPYTPQTVEVRQAARNFGDTKTDDTADLVQAYLRRKQHDSKTQNRN